MKNYIKPSVNVVELSAKEAIAALKMPGSYDSTKTFGFGSGASTFSNITRTIAAFNTSNVYEESLS